jgi:hypothetical protein
VFKFIRVIVGYLGTRLIDPLFFEYAETGTDRRLSVVFYVKFYRNSVNIDIEVSFV